MRSYATNLFLISILLWFSGCASSTQHTERKPEKNTPLSRDDASWEKHLVDLKRKLTPKAKQVLSDQEEKLILRGPPRLGYGVGNGNWISERHKAIWKVIKASSEWRIGIGKLNSRMFDIVNELKFSDSNSDLIANSVVRRLTPEVDSLVEAIRGVRVRNGWDGYPDPTWPDYEEQREAIVQGVHDKAVDLILVAR